MVDVDEDAVYVPTERNFACVDLILPPNLLQIQAILLKPEVSRLLKHYFPDKKNGESFS